MAKYGKNELQTVAASKPIILDTINGCPRGFVLHNNETGVFTLRSTINHFARYELIFKANIAVPEGGTAGAISVGIAQTGEVLPLSVATVTPTAAQEFNNVVSVETIDVPAGCCVNIAVENTTESADLTTIASPIDVQNAVLIINRIA